MAHYIDLHHALIRLSQRRYEGWERGKVKMREKEKVRERESPWPAAVAQCPQAVCSTPDTNFTPQLPFTPHCITICMASSPLIMLITCPDLLHEKWMYLAVRCLQIQLTAIQRCTFRGAWMGRFFHVAGFIQVPCFKKKLFKWTGSHCNKKHGEKCVCGFVHTRGWGGWISVHTYPNIRWAPAK